MNQSSIHSLRDVQSAAVGAGTRIWQFVAVLRSYLAAYDVNPTVLPVCRAFYSGDMHHSFANISKAQGLLGYALSQRIGEGPALVMPWYAGQKKVNRQFCTDDSVVKYGLAAQHAVDGQS